MQLYIVYLKESNFFVYCMVNCPTVIWDLEISNAIFLQRE